jgi:hypothetical protein
MLRLHDRVIRDAVVHRTTRLKIQFIMWLATAHHASFRRRLCIAPLIHRQHCTVCLHLSVLDLRSADTSTLELITTELSYNILPQRSTVTSPYHPHVVLHPTYGYASRWRLIPIGTQPSFVHYPSYLCSTCTFVPADMCEKSYINSFPSRPCVVNPACLGSNTIFNLTSSFSCVLAASLSPCL